VLLHDHGALQEWGYVACSRARLETRLYLADYNRLERETPLREPDPGAPPERAARALQRPAAEPLALDQRPDRTDTIIRFLAQQKKQLDRQCQNTTERLAAAHRELEHVHWWNRDRRTELQTEIAFYETVLERADATSEQLRERSERRSRMLALARQRDEQLPTRRPEPPQPRLQREPRASDFLCRRFSRVVGRRSGS
jgi:septal ring factor EnvC (AmiA/AmiB activator)